MTSDAFAVQTASSFDISYSYLSLTLSPSVDGEKGTDRSLRSPTGLQIDYNVAMFDYKTVATLSFAQYATSGIGSRPFTRIAIGGSYHFVHMNGQRVILDNQVEAKSWGVSPAIELTAGLSYLSIKDPNDQNFVFTTSVMDFSPRLLIEMPASPSFLLMLRLGVMMSLSSGSGASRYNVSYTGFVGNIGFKLTTF